MEGAWAAVVDRIPELSRYRPFTLFAVDQDYVLADHRLSAGDELCLYYGNQWDPGELIATTIVPWTSEWLEYYELWHATGLWLGGGVGHHV